MIAKKCLRWAMDCADNMAGCRACNRKRPTTELGATLSWHDELIATCRAEPLTSVCIMRQQYAQWQPTQCNSWINCQRQRREELSLVEQNTENFGTQRSNLVTQWMKQCTTQWKKHTVALGLCMTDLFLPLTMLNILAQPRKEQVSQQLSRTRPGKNGKTLIKKFKYTSRCNRCSPSDEQWNYELGSRTFSSGGCGPLA